MIRHAAGLTGESGQIPVIARSVSDEAIQALLWLLYYSWIASPSARNDGK